MYRVVLALHRRREGLDIPLAVPVVLVLQEERNHPRRRGGHEALGRRAGLDGGAQPAKVVAKRLIGRIRNVSDAGGELHQVADVVEPGARGPFREVEGVAHRGRDTLRAEAGEPLGDIGRVVRLAHLTVVDDVEAQRDLISDCAGHRLLNLSREARLADRRAAEGFPYAS